MVCGCNMVKAKTESAVILALRRLLIEKGKLSLVKETLSMLVLGFHGQGKTGAVTIDFAPHQAGGMVDWGSESRPRLRVEGSRWADTTFPSSATCGFVLEVIVSRSCSAFPSNRSSPLHCRKNVNFYEWQCKSSTLKIFRRSLSRV